MGDSRKRGASKQLSREDPGLDDEEGSAELESGTFKKAGDEVLAGRRIVRVKRREPPSAAPSNPFAGIQLVPTASTAAGTTIAEDGRSDENTKTINTEEGDEVDSKKKVDVEDSTGEETEKAKDENGDQCGKRSDDQAVSGATNVSSNAVAGTDQKADPLEKDSAGDHSEGKEKEGLGSREADKNGDSNGGLSSFQQHSSSKNAFTGLASTEALGSPFSFGSTSSGSLFGTSNSSSLSGASGSSIREGGSGFPPRQEVSTETGEENEKVAFSADSVMYEYLDGGWKERGKGEVKVNVSSDGGKARLVMRAKGNYRLILNASLYPEMKLASMEKKGVTFACVNSVSEGREGLSTFALKFKDSVTVEEFRVAVDKHKDSKPAETALPLKTPENSPTATDV